MNQENTSAPAENKMGTMPIGKLLFNMSLPMMISMLVQALYNIVDSIFVAKLSENALDRRFTCLSTPDTAYCSWNRNRCRHECTPFQITWREKFQKSKCNCKQRCRFIFFQLSRIFHSWLYDRPSFLRKSDWKC